MIRSAELLRRPTRREVLRFAGVAAGVIAARKTARAAGPALLAHNTGTAPNGNPGTSGSINSTGATLLIVCLGDDYASTAPVTDSLGNTWNALSNSYGGDGSSQIFYSYAKGSGSLSVGSGHTVTLNGYYPGFSFSAWNGTLTYPTNPFDQQHVSISSGSSSVQPGSITPMQAGELIVSCFGSDFANYSSVDSGFTLLDQLPATGGMNFGFGCAYLVQGAATAINPKFTLSGGSDNGCSVASFKASAAAAPSGFPVVY